MWLPRSPAAPTRWRCSSSCTILPRGGALSWKPSRISITASAAMTATRTKRSAASLADGLGVPFVAERIRRAGDRPARAAVDRSGRPERAARVSRACTAGASGGPDCHRAHGGRSGRNRAAPRCSAAPARAAWAASRRVRDVWIRPLLDASHAELRDELQRRGQSWREDATNADLANPRNRVRHELIPLSRRALQSLAAAGAGTRFADVARADEIALRDEAALAAATIVTVTAAADGARLDAGRLTALPAAVARRVVRLAVAGIRGDATPVLDEIDAVRAVAAGVRSSARICALDVEPSAGFVVLVRSGSDGSAPVSFRFDLPIPGEVHLPAAGWTLQAAGPIRPADRRGGRSTGSRAAGCRRARRRAGRPEP